MKGKKLEDWIVLILSFAVFVFFAIVLVYSGITYFRGIPNEYPKITGTIECLSGLIFAVCIVFTAIEIKDLKKNTSFKEEEHTR
jgi:threonine/homoserine/homoserine lactone efflux protein